MVKTLYDLREKVTRQREDLAVQEQMYTTMQRDYDFNILESGGRFFTPDFKAADEFQITTLFKPNVYDADQIICRVNFGRTIRPLGIELKLKCFQDGWEKEDKRAILKINKRLGNSNSDYSIKHDHPASTLVSFYERLGLQEVMIERVLEEVFSLRREFPAQPKVEDQEMESKLGQCFYNGKMRNYQIEK